MKNLLLAVLCLGATTALAADLATVNFSYMGQNTYVSCNYVESQAEMILNKLGAQNVHVDCNGGLQDGVPYMPPEASITFEQGNKTGSVVFKGYDDSCDFNVKLIDAILEQYKHSSVQKQESCWDSQGNYNYTVQL